MCCNKIMHKSVGKWPKVVLARILEKKGLGGTPVWYSVNTDFTHTVSGVPCVVEQSALVMFYEGRSAVTTVANLWDISLKTNIFSSWIDLHSQVNQCSIKSLDYLNCLMRDEQCRIIPISAKGIMWQ